MLPESMPMVARDSKVNEFSDGRCYSYAPRASEQTNRLLEVERLQSVYVKVPSSRGYEIHEKYTYNYRSTENEIRPPEGLERAEMLDTALAQFQEFRYALSGEGWANFLPANKMRVLVHWLLIHHLNFQRLRSIPSIKIPEARFVFLMQDILSKSWFRGTTRSSKLQPGIIQAAVDGILLFDMYTPTGVKSEFRQYLPTISRRLKQIGKSNLDYYDWYLKNFIYAPSTDELWYIDPKPTVLMGKHANQVNFRIMRDYFVNA